jgi:hypothetical protein
MEKLYTLKRKIRKTVLFTLLLLMGISLQISYGQNVGITNGASITPYSLLQVHDAVNATGQLFQLTNTTSGTGAATNGFGINMNTGFDIEFKNQFNNASAGFSFFTNNGSTTEKLTLLNGGNVGIGDNTPAALFTVGSGDLFQILSTGEARGIAGAVGAPSFSFTGNTSSGFYSSGTNILNFATNGTERIRIDAAGNIGIGAASNNCAILDMSSIADRGMLIPKLALTSLTTYAPATGTAVDGMLIYNTTNTIGGGRGLYYWSTFATKWVNILDNASPGIAWFTEGNTGLVDATNNYLGTLDATPVKFVSGASGPNVRMTIAAAGTVGINATPSTNYQLYVSDNSTTDADASIFGEATGNAKTFGVYGKSAAATGYGVYGINSNASGNAIIGAGNGIASVSLGGGSGGSFASTNVGAYGYGDATAQSYGVWGKSISTTGVAVEADNTAAVGTAVGFGIFATSKQTGGSVIAACLNGLSFYANTAISGVNTDAAGTGIIGVNSAASGASTGSGIIAYTSQSLGNAFYGKNNHSSGTGVYGVGQGATGVSLTAGSGGAFTGTSTGILGLATAAGGTALVCAGNNAYATTGGTLGFVTNAAGGGIAAASKGTGVAVSAYHLTGTTNATDQVAYICGPSYAVQGINSAAVVGTNATTSYAGVYGINQSASAFNFGVWGYDNTTTNKTGGVMGSYSNTVWGSLGYKNTTNTYGVYATSSILTGASGGKIIQGTAPSNGIAIGAWGDLFGADIHGQVYGAFVQGNRYSLYTDGILFNNNFIVQLQKANNTILQKSTSNDLIPLYSNVSTDVTVQTSGLGTLQNGYCKISYDENFAKTTSAKYQIIISVTPMGDCKGVYVQYTDNGFEVKELNGGNSNVQFSYIAIGKRSGYENPQLPAEVLKTDYITKINNGLSNDAIPNIEGQGLYYQNGQLFNGKIESIDNKEDSNMLISTPTKCLSITSDPLSNIKNEEKVNLLKKKDLNEVLKTNTNPIN